MTWVNVAAGTYVFRRGEPGDALYVTETGILDAVIDEGAASERTLATFLPGEFFGEMALLTQEPRSASVRALVDSRLGRISCDQFIGLLKTHPQMGMRLSLVLSQSLARTSSQLSKRKGRVTTIIPIGDQQRSDLVAEQLLEFMERQHHRSVVIILLGDAVLSSHHEHGVVSSSLPGLDSIQPMPRGGHSLRIDGTALEAMDLSSLAAMIHTLRTRHDHVVIWAPPQHALKRLELLTHFDQTLILACHPHPPEELTRTCVALQAVLKESFRIAFLAPGQVPLPTLPCPTRYPPLKLNTPPVGNSNGSRESPGPDGLMGAQHGSMDRLARTLSGLTIGLALGSGTAQGLAHLGVMKALTSAGIPIDLIAGTSGGALYGSLLASGLVIDDAITRVMHETRRNLIDKLDFTIPLRGVVRGKKIGKMVRNVIGEITFAELSIPLFAIATDLETGEEVVIQDGPVYQGVRASISVPGIFEPYPMNGRILIDGVVVNPLPVGVARNKGADIVIAVQVPAPGALALETKARKRAGRAKPSPYGIMSTIVRSHQFGADKLAEHALAEADVLIKPDVARFGWREYRAAPQIIEAGFQAGQAAIPAIEALIRSRK